MTKPGVVAYEYEVRRKDGIDDWSTTIQLSHPEDSWSNAIADDLLEYRNVRELVYSDPTLDEEWDVVMEVKISDAKMTVHLPIDFAEAHDGIHEAIEAVLGARHVDDFTIDEAYEIEEW